MEAIRRGNRTQGAKSSSVLTNPGKKFFLKAATECIRLVNTEVDKGSTDLKRRRYYVG